MARYKHYKRPNLNDGYVRNQSELLNEQTYMYHYQNLYEIALNRVKWLNLPSGCDSRFLEETLLLNGQAIIFQDEFVKDLFYSTRVVANAPLNVYDNPTQFRSVGNQGWSVNVPYERGVLVWETKSRYPTIQHIGIFAQRLADTDRLADVNLQTLKRPFIITGPEEKYQEMVNMYRNIDSNEPAIVGVPTLNQIEVKVLDTKVEYLGAEMQYRKQLIMNEFMTFLGIDNSGMEKKERMTENEVKRNSSIIEMKRANYLDPRREAAEELNKRFGLNIEVVWNHDNISPSWRFLNDLEEQIDNVGVNSSNSEVDKRNEEVDHNV